MLLKIIWNSTFVLYEIMENKKRKKTAKRGKGSIERYVIAIGSIRRTGLALIQFLVT